MDVKKEVFTKLDSIVKQGAILASNTSYLNIDEIAAVTKRPEYVLGLHFFSPANVMKLLEIVRGEKTADDVLMTAMKLSKKIGKVAAVSGVCPGFIGNRMLSPRQEQANLMIMEGANYWEIDDVLLEFGFPMGPFQMSDLAGVDIGWHRDPERIETLRDALCAVGRWGQKVSKGFYDYDQARQRTPSDEVKQIIAEFAAKAGKEQRTISRMRSASGCFIQWSTKEPKSLKKGWRNARAISMSSGSTAMAGRFIPAARCSGPIRLDSKKSSSV